MRRLRYAVLSLGAVLLGLLGTSALAVQPAAASSWTSGYCPTSKGVTVVVDFSAFNGDVQTRCYPDASSSTTGVTALQGAGFNPTGTANYGLAFVCTIQGLPDKPCPTTPPKTAYWSYWHASNGGAWTYSQEGASTRNVTLGGFEGWRFGDGSAPPNKSTTRPAPVVLPTFHMGPAASTKAAPKASHSSSPSTTPSRTATPSATSTDPGVVLTTPDGTSTSSDVQAGGALPGGDSSGGSSPWPFVIGVAAVGLIGGGAGLVVYQRRRVGGL